MPKTRTQAAQNIVSSFLPVERQTILLAAQAHRAVATMIEERQTMRIGKREGAVAVERASQGAHHLVSAVNAFLAAHDEMRDVGLQYNLETMFGPESAGMRSVVPLKEAA